MGARTLGLCHSTETMFGTPQAKQYGSEICSPESHFFRLIIDRLENLHMCVCKVQSSAHFGSFFSPERGGQITGQWVASVCLIGGTCTCSTTCPSLARSFSFSPSPDFVGQRGCKLSLHESPLSSALSLHGTQWPR